jgi:hypothetical protein
LLGRGRGEAWQVGEKLAGVLGLWMIEHVLRLTDLDELTVMHYRHPVRDAPHQREIVSDEDQG